MKANDADSPPQAVPRHKRPILRSIALGLLTAGLLAGGLPVWMMAQLGGPVSFWSFALFIVIPLLVVLALIAPAKGVFRGVACGLAFSLPVAVACFLISMTAVTGQGGLERYHGEMRAVGGITITLSVMAMGFVALSRQPVRANEASQ
jgi:hypothetical protein